MRNLNMTGTSPLSTEYQLVLLQRESYGLYYSDWLRPVNMEVLQFLVLRATSG